MDQISVVIPTQRRLHALSRTLAAVADQDCEDFEIELVVVCSGASGEYRSSVHELISKLPVPAKVVEKDRGGAAGARNAGVELAAGDLILFLNEDTPPASRDLVRSHVTIHRASDDEWRGVLGRVVWDPRTQSTPVMEWLSRSGKMNDYAGLAEPDAPVRIYAPNFSLRRSALLAVGGFDERFWRYGWEEYDLGLRLADRGFTVAFAPELVVTHDHRYTKRDSLRRMETVGEGAALLNRVHAGRPDLETPAPHGLKALVARAFAPVAMVVPVPGWLPTRLSDPIFRALHYATLARGYAHGR
jgi:GT2 family glycosyltransferase